MVYEEGTGQLLSADKCLITFGKKCSSEHQVATMVILKIIADGFENKYHWLHVPEGRMEVGKFQSQR